MTVGAGTDRVVVRQRSELHVLVNNLATDVERFVKRVGWGSWGWFRGAPERRSGAWLLAQQASGPRGQGGAPAAKRGRTTLTPGWRLLRDPGARGLRWAAGEGVVMRRAAGGLAARLMFAGRDRRRALRREVLHTDRGDAGIGRHSRDGDRFCSGGRPAHHGVLAVVQPGRDSESSIVFMSCHLGPHEPGEFAGDGGGDHVAARLAGVEAAELAAQTQLGRPGAATTAGSSPAWRLAMVGPTLARDL